MPTYKLAVDVANRALQHCGLGSDHRIATFGPPGTGDDSQACSETYFCYDKLRVAELEANVWRFALRKCALRPLSTQTMLVVFGVYDPATTYPVNWVVQDSAGDLWFSKVANNTGNPPGADFTNWSQYFGSLVAQPWAADTDPNAPQPWSSVTNYALGVQAIGSDGYVYSSAVNGNLNNDPVTDGGVHWYKVALAAQGTGYYAGEVVYDSSNAVYISLINSNSDTPPSANWVTLTDATLVEIQLIYPIGTGPTGQSETRNAYMLPNGFLRKAPQDPKQGVASYLGAPRFRQADDWEFEANFIITDTFDPIVFVFVADIAEVPQFDPMFCEALAAKVGMEVCEPLTQSDAKMTRIAQKYAKYVDDAKTTNGIILGPTEEELDDWIACRV